MTAQPGLAGRGGFDEPPHLTRHFIKAGDGVADWLTAERLRRSPAPALTGNMPIERVAELVGFNSAVTWRQQF